MARVAWNKGLTKETSPQLAKLAKQKSEWWKTHDTTETRKKIGLASKGRPGLKGEKGSNWKGGRYTTVRDKYIYVYQPDHPNARKSGKGTGGYVLEHRLVMEETLGRYLLPEEDVNHRNGIKDDNRPENLMLVRHNAHFEEHECPKCGFKLYIR